MEVLNPDLCQGSHKPKPGSGRGCDLLSKCQGARHQVTAVGMRKGGHVQRMAILKTYGVDLIRGCTGWRKESEKAEVGLR